jgi:hypothetical protein
MRGKCGECEYFFVRQDQPFSDWTKGECRRYPPPEFNTTPDFWTFVSAERGWCGEWKPQDTEDGR